MGSYTVFKLDSVSVEFDKSYESYFVVHGENRRPYGPDRERAIAAAKRKARALAIASKES